MRSILLYLVLYTRPTGIKMIYQEFFLTIIILHSLSWNLAVVDGAKILGLFAHPSESHFAVMRSLMLELTKREHNVTVYSSHRLNERIENLREIIVEPEFPFWKQFSEITGSQSGGLLKASKLTERTMQKSLATTGANAVNYFLSNEPVKKLLNLPVNEFDYDLIIVDLFYTEALLAVGHFFDKPTIGILNTNFESYMDRVLEQMVPAACSPISYETYKPEAGYWNRLGVIRNCMSRRKQFITDNWGAQESVMRNHFAQFKGVSELNIGTLQAELAILLLNSHVPLLRPRPLLLNTVAAGGMHIRPPRELPWPLRRFLDESRAGVIYMNLGNEQLCTDVPKHIMQVLLNTLGKRKERVVWTCHDHTELKNLPTNIMVQHAVPQADILAHPHVHIFLMNGDLLSTQEGIMRHVPMISVPIFRNEVRNAELAVQLGVGIHLNHNNLTETTLNWALQTIKEDSTYQLTIRQVATTFRDRPLGAVETCMYWMDYVLRHKGGADLKTLGGNIPSSQLHLFDLFIYYFAIALLSVGVLAAVIYGIIILMRKREIGKMYSKLS
ncbi:UDP-glycosyltransferase UGT5 isoform X2 [Bactrocera tryoni]|uniref:UDP-glycosyltransferase UGT5 isoform X2 n=1 Tax=Bactrocera tryoni TaxID=59916 RepID=UPI001A958845|nr:UDP-glycosyltransferase UGT5 isoform X2 [Bactrocera tryoni]